MALIKALIGFATAIYAGDQTQIIQRYAPTQQIVERNFRVANRQSIRNRFRQI